MKTRSPNIVSGIVMKMKGIKSTFIVAIFILYSTTSCGLHTQTSVEATDNGLSLTPPLAISRAIVNNVLFADVTLSYEENGTEQIVGPITVTKSTQADAWELEIFVPADTDFKLTITWFDFQDPTRRLDLSTGTRSFSALTESSSFTLNYDIDDFDSNVFDDDSDTINNLQERINNTSPFDSNKPLLQTQLDTVYLDVLEESSLSIEDSDSVGTIIDTGWSPAPASVTDEDVLECQTRDTTFEAALASRSFSESCSAVSDNCSLTFDQLATESAQSNLISYETQTPSLNAPTVVSYLLTANSANSEPYSRRYVFCINALNEPPIANNDVFTALDTQPLIVPHEGGLNLLSNDSDDDHVSNQNLRVLEEPIRAPAFASNFELRSDGGFTYVFDSSLSNEQQGSQTDSFEYEVTDGIHRRSATVTLEIVTVDRPPTQTGTLPLLSAIVGIAFSEDLSQFFSDPEGSDLSFQSAQGSLPANGPIDLSETGQFSYTGEPGDEGTYSIELQIQDGTNTLTSILAFEVLQNQPPVSIGISDPSALESGEILNLSISNGFSDPENQPLEFTLTTNPESNLQINPVSGVISGQLSTSGLYDLTIYANDGVNPDASFVIEVTQLEALVGILALPFPSELELSANREESTSESIEIRNSGTDLLTFTANADVPWLTVEPNTNPLNEGAETSITVVAQCPSDPGTYFGTIIIDAVEAGTYNVPVNLECLDNRASLLSVSPTNLDLNALVQQSAQGSIQIGNQGNATLNFTIESSSSWLETELSQGEIPPGDSRTLSVMASCEQDAITRSGTLNIASELDSLSLNVNLNCSSNDSDNDGVTNALDNCPAEANSDQVDLDADGMGDACDSDIDGDSVPNTLDNCPLDINPTQSDLDDNGYGDACDEIYFPSFSPLTSDFLELYTLLFDTTQDSVLFTNTGPGSMTPVVSSDSDWLSVDISPAFIGPGEEGVVTIYAECGANEEYKDGRITIDASIYDQAIIESFDVNQYCYGNYPGQ